MVDMALLNYIKKQLATGHSVQELTTFLTQQGYDPASIQECINRIYNENLSPHAYTSTPIEDHHLKRNPLPLIIIGILMVTIVAFLVFYLFFSEDQGDSSQSQLSLSIDFSSTTFSESEAISFTRLLTKTGPAKSIQAYVGYEIRNDAGTVVYTYEENLEVFSQLSKRMIFNIPDSKPGVYSLIVKATYNGMEKSKTNSFVMKREQASSLSSQTNQANCFDGTRNQDEEGIDCGGPCKPCLRQCPIFYDDDDPCTVDICNSETDFKPIHEDIVPCCGNRMCEYTEDEGDCPEDCIRESGYDPISDTPDSATGNIEILESDMPLIDQIELIKQNANQDLQKALDSCGAIVFPYYKDQCFYSVAAEVQRRDVCEQVNEERTRDKCFTRISKTTDDSDLCSDIESDLRRDSCYMGFALKGDYSVCDKIKDSYYLQSCRQLQEISLKSPDTAEEHYDEIE